jgi:hypothetical protein
MLYRCASCAIIVSDVNTATNCCMDCYNNQTKQWVDYKKDMETGADQAVKHDQGKPDFTQMSWELLEMHARVREFGSKKYSRNNWKKGFKITRSLAAALRHIFQYLGGEDNDKESGISHLGHAVCCLEHAIYDSINHPENDDRKS